MEDTAIHQVDLIKKKSSFKSPFLPPFLRGGKRGILILLLVLVLVAAAFVILNIKFSKSANQWFGASSFLNLPTSFDWNGAHFVKIASPLPLPSLIRRYVIPSTPEADEESHTINIEQEISPLSPTQVSGLGRDDIFDYQALISSASDKFILAVSKPADWDKNQLEEAARRLFALSQPEKKSLILPDGTEAVELFYNPERFELKKLPTFDLEFIKEGNEELAFATIGKTAILSNSAAFLFQFLLTVDKI